MTNYPFAKIALPDRCCVNPNLSQSLPIPSVVQRGLKPHFEKQRVTMSSCYRSVCSSRPSRQNVPPLQQLQGPSSNQHQLTLTAWAGLQNGGFLHQFETRLNSSWRAAQFIKWYAVLINVVEAVSRMLSSSTTLLADVALGLFVV